MIEEPSQIRPGLMPFSPSLKRYVRYVPFSPSHPFGRAGVWALYEELRPDAANEYLARGGDHHRTGAGGSGKSLEEIGRAIFYLETPLAKIIVGQ